MTGEPFTPGDQAWWARFERIHQRDIPCPVCFGNRTVTLILGNGDKVGLPCDYCGYGLDEPTGTVREYVTLARAERVTIESVTTRAGAGDVEHEYTVLPGYHVESADLFDTEAEAIARAEELAAADQAAEDARGTAVQAHAHKSFGWKAGYHMREAQRHREGVAYHERMAVVCQGKARS